MWDMDSAVQFVRLHSDKALVHGYLLFIGGSVVTKGSSDRNLDLLAVAKDKGTEVGNLDFIFNGLTRMKTGDGYIMMQDSFNRVVCLKVV